MAKKTWIGTDGDYGASGNWSPSGVPATGDEVYIPAGSGAFSANLDQSAVDLDSFTVAAGHVNLIASASAYLQISTAAFEYSGNGLAYIDLGSTSVSPNIRDTALPTAVGGSGLYLIGTGIGVCNVVKGYVGIAAIFGETATATTIRSVGSGAHVHVGSGCTLTNFYQTAGDNLVECATTTCKSWGGALTTRGAVAHATITVSGGEAYIENSGTNINVYANGGEVIATGSGESRTWTNLYHNAPGIVTYDPTVVTITNYNAPDSPVRLDAQLAV